jgi:hypothetical protein
MWRSPVPEKEIAARGGAKRWRTKKLPNGEVIQIAVVRTPGPKGGHTVAGKPVKPKGKK